MSNQCELCDHDTLARVYEPEGSTRGLSVYLCNHCGLVQSMPRIDRALRAPASISSGADWGNIRYGKGFRTAAALDALARNVDLSRALSLLDVGSNRGSFAHAFLEQAPHASVVAIEPDERMTGSCADLERTELTVARIEDVALETERFDIVHSCHTIEHLAHPARSLADHWRVLKPGGYLVLDAPNIALIGADDVLEEWFIDKHLTHFSARTLSRMIETAGFAVVARPDPADRINLLFVARKITAPMVHDAPDAAEVRSTKKLIAGYVAGRSQNLEAIASVAAELSALATKRVALWGAGRLFDSLVVHGHFDAKLLTVLIDKHLKAHVGERHGCALAGPEALAEARPEVVVVMSRGFAAEIAAEARAIVPDAEIVFFSDLISRARLRHAA